MTLIVLKKIFGSNGSGSGSIRFYFTVPVPVLSVSISRFRFRFRIREIKIFRIRFGSRFQKMWNRRALLPTVKISAKSVTFD